MKKYSLQNATALVTLWNNKHKPQHMKHGLLINHDNICKMDALLRNKIATEFRIKVHTCFIHWLTLLVKQSQVIMTI